MHELCIFLGNCIDVIIEIKVVPLLNNRVSLLLLGLPPARYPLSIPFSVVLLHGLMPPRRWVAKLYAIYFSESRRERCPVIFRGGGVIFLGGLNSFREVYFLGSCRLRILEKVRLHWSNFFY